MLTTRLPPELNLPHGKNTVLEINKQNTKVHQLPSRRSVAVTREASSRTSISEQDPNAGNSHVGVLESIGMEGDLRHFRSLEQHVDGCV